MAYTFTETVVLEKTTCASCGVIFAMPEHLMKKRRENHDGFYCPNGHSLSFGDGPVERLQKQLQAQQAETSRQQENFFAEQRKTERMQLEADEAARKAKRAAKRSSAGTCPCCQRTFSQMARHMKTKHPEYPGKP